MDSKDAKRATYAAAAGGTLTLKALFGAGRLRLSWTAPPGGNVHIFRFDARPSFRAGEKHPAAQFSTLNELPVHGERAIDDRVPDRGAFYLPVTIVGDLAMVGKVLNFIPVEDVDQVEAELRGNEILVRWKWPRGTKFALLMWRNGQAPTGPEDRAASRRLVSRGEYLSNGGVSIPGATTETCYIRVFGKAVDRELFSSATSAGASTSVAGRIVVQYKVKRDPLSSKVVITFSTTVSVYPMPEIVIVAAHGSLQPKTPSDGQEIRHIESRSLIANDDLKIELKLPPRRPLYLFAFLVNATDERVVLQPPKVEQLKFR